MCLNHVGGWFSKTQRDKKFDPGYWIKLLEPPCAGLQAIIHNPTSKLPHQYLANRQGTRFAVIGIHSPTEKKLFSQLMKENPSFNRDKKDPDWKAAIQIWNTEYADGKTIFYKV